MSAFEEIYKSNLWGFGSGHGSLPSVTKSYREFLQTFIHENNIHSVVDYGCGDWQFSKLVDWGNTDYTGLDVVESVVKDNQQAYGSDTIHFQHITHGQTNLPKADLIIVKDVLQHLHKDEIDAFITKVLPHYKYALVTNCILPTEDINKEILSGEFRPLDLRQAPYNLGGKVVHTFTGPKVFSKSERKFFPAWKKLVLLVD